MGNLRVITVAVLGMSLIAACGSGRAAPTLAPDRTVSPTPSPQNPVPSESSAASPAATVAASAAWATAEGARLSGNAALLDVTATGPRDAWAIGYQDSAEDREGLPAVLRWDGSRWREVKLPVVGAYHLEGVGASGPDDVWVVGNGRSAFAAHWNGQSWTRQRPFGVTEDYRLDGVATDGGKSWFAGNGPSGGVVLEWKEQEFHNVMNAGGTLNAITAREGDVWAVGVSEKRTPLVCHGTGDGTWDRTEIPEIPGGGLNRVWQISPSDVWAVGEITAGPDNPEVRYAQPLVLHWDGSRWTRVEVPVPRGTLHGITAIGPGDLWVSGIDAGHAGQPLFLHFDGRRWSREYGPLFRAYAEGQQYDESDDVGRVGIARVPGTGTLLAVGSIGSGDDEAGFLLRR
ncbi:hypothetical protein [Streptosporangium sp. 'caverna']|uniref:hypothetical protein n=1 Tax=Streptosporangium sp. 'caverna' TaxID=2202249 RepID=UPI000D7DBC6C|nr:hypothetical protein [Streptosporangium sp. 'caverna']AWS46004.1 hypothetical protein DKM19_36610 [Streptosporangium sp. 'caverna']